MANALKRRRNHPPPDELQVNLIKVELNGVDAIQKRQHVQKLISLIYQGPKSSKRSRRKPKTGDSNAA